MRFVRAALVAALATAAALAGGPAQARCETDLRSAQRSLQNLEPGDRARSTAEREIAAAKRAMTERLCQEHVQAAMHNIQQEEAVELPHRKAGGSDCALDPGCQSEVKPQKVLKPPHGRFGGPNCRLIASCPD